LSGLAEQATNESTEITFQVNPLSTEDQRHLEAAQGWLILGDFIEADAELDNITPSEAAFIRVRKFARTSPVSRSSGSSSSSKSVFTNSR